MIPSDLQHGCGHKANTCSWLLNTGTLASRPDLHKTWLEVLSQDCPWRTLHILGEGGALYHLGRWDLLQILVHSSAKKTTWKERISHFFISLPILSWAHIFHDHNDCESNLTTPVSISGGSICTKPTDKLVSKSSLCSIEYCTHCIQLCSCATYYESGLWRLIG